jgi:glutathione synthase/RimK-type ligase-like ATP-grasp enzyme
MPRRRIRVYPYKMGSKSARKLARALGALRVRENSPLNHRHLVINWGNSAVPNWNSRMLNNPRAVANAINKIDCFNELNNAEVDCLRFTTDRDEAQDWLDRGRRVIVRRLITAHSGEGIEMLNPGDRAPSARLYTKYRPKRHEYRVFVLNGRIIDYSIKRRRADWELLPNFNKYIRNYVNGWVFCRDNLTLPARARELAINAIRALNLDFGAVEIGETRRGNCFVIEINTAPSLEGETTSYRIINAFRQEVQNGDFY